eukprot:15456392-Alexandrium_andersonii.AAC.1
MARALATRAGPRPGRPPGSRPCTAGLAARWKNYADAPRRLHEGALWATPRPPDTAPPLA